MKVWKEKLQNLPSIFYYLVAGIGLGVGTVLPWLWWLVIPGITLFLWTIIHTKSWSKAFFGGWLAFTIKLLFAQSYYLTTFPIKWIDLALGKLEFLVIGFYWLTVALAIGLSGALLAVVLYFIVKRFVPGLFILSALIFWVPAEILGALFFSVFTYGSGGTLNTLYTFGYSGYLLAQHPLIFKLASFGGVFILSFTTVLLGVILYYCLSNYKNQPVLLKVILVLGLVFIGTIWWPTDNSSITKTGVTVAVVDTRFGGDAYFALPIKEREELRVKQLLEATKSALKTGAEYVVMSEDSRYLPNDDSLEKNYALFRFQQGNPEAIVIDSSFAPILPTNIALRVNIYDGKAKTAYAIDKQNLVPQGEFMTNFVYFGFFKLIQSADIVDKINKRLNYRPGPLNDQRKFPNYIPGILFCFSEADPLAVARLVKERDLPFVAHPISHAWFHSPYSLWFQFDTMLRIQARWNKTAIISAGNMVDGALYDQAGEKIMPEQVSSGDYWTVGLVTL